jgi:UDP-hydrolysing UDP-N-acetyl-D-glucosamine 2-epimerase
MKKICVISGSRADYGLLYWTMKSIQDDPSFKLQIIATCMHLSPKFGNTWEQFEKDGFILDRKVDLGEMDDSRMSIIQQISKGITGFYESFIALKPDLIVILGDRYEMLAAAQAAVFADIPIAHIHGGEITEGAFDDIIRHSITKMSSFHFTSTETYRKRVIQMGEFPKNVTNVGAVGLENIKRMNFFSKDELEKDLGFKFKLKNILVTYHPVTATNEDASQLLIEALEEHPEVGQIITMPNSDPGHDKIFKAWQNYAKDHRNVFLTTNLGFQRYLSVMKICDAVVGNSSSGIIEAPFLKVPTLNIGVRQLGRIHAKSVVNCLPHEIKTKLNFVLSLKVESSDLYGDGSSSSKIIDVIKSLSLQTKKGFYDL